MKSLNKKLIFLFKIITNFVIYYLSNNINKKFFENLYDSYLIIITSYLIFQYLLIL